MSEFHTGGTPVNLGATGEIARRLVEQGRFESNSEACREGLHRLDAEQRIVDTLVRLGEQGMASGVAEGFEIDEFIDEICTDTLTVARVLHAATDIERHLPPGEGLADER